MESRFLGDVVVLVPEVFQDSRGFFMETFREDKFREHGLPSHFVQDNHSRSEGGVIRGLHFQWDPQMGKLMRVTVGSAFLVAVDVRKGSPTLGKWAGVEVSAENNRQVWAPAGFARGFCVLSDFPESQYKCTGLYNTKPTPAFCGVIRRSGSNGQYLLLKRNSLRRTKRRRLLRNGSPGPSRTIFATDAWARLEVKGNNS